MKIENLSVNQRIKNYKELCNILEIDVKSGKSKQLQLKELERYIDYKKDGNAFIVTEIYDIPLTKVDNRKGGNNRTNIDINEKLLIYMLMDATVTGAHELIVSRTTMFKSLGYINNNYSVAIEYKKETLSILEVSSISYDYFISNQYKKMCFSIDRAIKSLVNKRLAICEFVRCVEYYDNDLCRFITRPATQIEKAEILLFERQLLDKYGYEKIGAIFATNKTVEFYKELNKILFDKLGIKRSFMAYRITLHDQLIKNIMNEYNKLILDGYTVDNLKLELNNISKSSNEKTFINKSNKMNELRESDENNRIARFMVGDNFIKDGKTLFECLCDINNKSDLYQQIIDYKLTKQKERNEFMELFDSIGDTLF